MFIRTTTTAFTGWQAIYTVPAGKVFIVSDATTYGNSNNGISYSNAIETNRFEALHHSYGAGQVSMKGSVREAGDVIYGYVPTGLGFSKKLKVSGELLDI